VNHFDQASRYAAKLDAPEFLAWALNAPPGASTFLDWLDTRAVPFPGATDRASDTVAWLERADRNGEPWAVAVEFQSQPDATMFGRLLGYLSGLWLACKPDAERGSRFHLGAVVVNLTGTGTTARDMDWPAVGLRTQLLVVERNLATEPASALLDAIESGARGRALLPWVPLMSGGGTADTVQRWKALASAEPNYRRRGEYGGLALVFAEKGKCRELWDKELEGWNVEESAVVNAWIAKAEARGEARGRAEGEARGRAEGEVQEAQVMVLRLGARKFGPAPASVEAAVRAISSRERLTAIADRLFDATSWDDLLATP
jgi:hypothetical protein